MKIKKLLILLFLYLMSIPSYALITHETYELSKGYSASRTMQVPAFTQVNDLLIMQVVIRDAAVNTINAPSGWTEIGSQQQDGNVLQSVYYRIAQASDIFASYSWSWGSSRWNMLATQVYRGVDTANPIDAFASRLGMNGRNVRAPSITTSNPNAMLIALYALGVGDQSFTPSNSMTEVYDSDVDGGDGLTIMSAYELRTSAGNTGRNNGRTGVNNEDAVAHSIALNELVADIIPPALNSITTDCNALTSFVIQFSEELDPITAENISNYSLVNSAANPIGIISAALTTDTVVITLASSMNDMTPYTVTVNNVEDLAGNEIAVNSSDNFILSCDLNCITDNFVGPGSLSSSWSVGNSSGSFGDPRIVANGRLRLTDDSGDVSTVATLLNQFPGAENRIEIEFDYYGYDGNGADGIAVNFSNASVPPSAGAFGGSLGYAQKTGIAGFAGGWLGVGIDEYGNFSTSGEGRVGGGGSRIIDSISLRGSGSGTSGYPYLTGTSSLSPGIDQAGSTPNPGHRYRIMIDHTSGGSTAIASVERDSGSGYEVEIPEFNIFAANPSQANVPNNWVISFTGSTGGATNIHEIGDLKVCAAQPIETFSQVDHYDISHTSPGLTCEATLVTITAHDASHTPVNVLTDTSIIVTTLPAISGIINSPVTMLNGSSTASIYLQQSSALANVDIDVSDGSFSDDDGSSEDPKISFLDTVFRFYADGNHIDTTPINTQISAMPSLDIPAAQSLTLRAIETDTDTGACQAALAGNQIVDIAYICKDPNTCSAQQLSFTANETKNITGSDDGSVLSYTSVDMVFVNGVAPFNFNFPDAGKIQLRANLIVAEALPEPAFTLSGSSNEFVVKPFAFDLVFPANYDAADADGIKFVSAGTAFDMTIRAINWHTDDDANKDGIPDAGSDLSDNIATPNFGQELASSVQTLTIDRSLKLPLPGADGSLTSTVINTSASAGLFTGGKTAPAASLTWDEVGIIDIDVDLSDYLATSGANISGRQTNVGRFYPDHFSLVSSSLVNSCGDFSYMGQQGINIIYTLEAQGVSNNRTLNYDGDFVKMIPAEDIRFVSENDNEGDSYQDRLDGFSSTSWGSGKYIYSDSGRFLRDPLMLPDGPYYDLQIGIEVSDDDGVELIDRDMNENTSTTCNPLVSCNAKRLDILADLDLRFGQLKLSNVFGPEAFDLYMTVRTEYYDGTGFVLNSDDSCTILAATDPPFTPSNWMLNLQAGDAPASIINNVNSGIGLIRFEAAGVSNNGSVDYSYSVDNWLKTENDDDGDYADNPKGKVTFGQFRGNDRMIYWREIIR